MHRIGRVAGWFALVIFVVVLLAAGVAGSWYSNPIFRLGWFAFFCAGCLAFVTWAVCLIGGVGQRSIAWWRARGFQ